MIGAFICGSFFGAFFAVAAFVFGFATGSKKDDE
jgi:hypothetical protein